MNSFDNFPPEKGYTVYNLTIKVDVSIANEWLNWMLDIHIPEILGTGCFIKHQLLRLIEPDDSEGVTYAIQYFAETIEKYKYYISHYDSTFRRENAEMWGDKYVDFRTLLQVVN